MQTPKCPAVENMQKLSLVAASQEASLCRTVKDKLPSKPLRLSLNHSRELLSFTIKIAALETVRRLSKAWCPILWRVVQSFQLLSYPPFKWLQRWGPLGIIIRGAQKISRPLLLLSIITAFTDHSVACKGTADGVDDSQPLSDTLCNSSSDSMNTDEPSKGVVPDNWLLKLFSELEKQGISLPERFNENELHRFYTAANGDLACLTSSLKKTIRWRESYNILSSEELEVWSHLVFWHGFDVILRPSLVIRLGLACSSLAPHDRPRFAQAVVSQIDHGILGLTEEKDSSITVLMDCEGLSPSIFPMSMMRSFCTLVQDHYPNRLGTLLILRLPPAVLVIAQTFIQVLKPVTQEKLRIMRDDDHRLLFEFLRTVPAVLGGDCRCSRCIMLSANGNSDLIREISDDERTASETSDVFPLSERSAADLPYGGNCDHLLSAGAWAVSVAARGCVLARPVPVQVSLTRMAVWLVERTAVMAAWPARIEVTAVGTCSPGLRSCR
ncbi:hypothetical protein AXF42_Ash017719 [Apostasia shenzhenica]|uniref:CRAL-TRIO domain-containing protein n=1 Tax=Apostasia shenzhenica TaxID=1088818 RepID=A0A2I0B662_9ASPA|nr:hypothetical protein AXF42_Ash017719 [Apostasia shenzhenica]